MGKTKSAAGRVTVRRKRSAQPLRVVSCEVIFDGRVFSVTRDTVIEPGGGRVEREVVRHAGSAVIVPRRADGRILLVRQFRLAAQQFLWELAAGRLDVGESPLEAARRELQEETGLTAGHWKFLGEFFASPGYVDERMWLFLAEDLRRGRSCPEPDEVIRQRWFTPAEFGNLIRRGKIQDAKTLLGYFLLPNRRR